MRFLVGILLLIGAAESMAREGFVGVLIDQGFVVDVDDARYTSLGLFYLSSDDARVSVEYMKMNGGYSDMANIGLVKQIRLNRKGLYTSVGMEVVYIDNKERAYPDASRLAAILGLGVVLTRRHFLSQVEISIHYPRVELNFSIGY